MHEWVCMQGAQVTFFKKIMASKLERDIEIYDQNHNSDVVLFQEAVDRYWAHTTPQEPFNASITPYLEQVDDAFTRPFRLLQVGICIYLPHVYCTGSSTTPPFGGEGL